MKTTLNPQRDFVTTGLKKFLNLVVNSADATDIEVVESSETTKEKKYCRKGILKDLKLIEPLIFFNPQEMNEILSLIIPDRLKFKHVTIDEQQNLQMKPFNAPLSFSFSIQDIGHYRATILSTRTGRVLTLRRLSYVVPSWDMIGVPEFLKEKLLSSIVVRKTQTSVPVKGGLILITGPMGSGKTTTMNSIIKAILDETSVKVLTVEDPIEYVHWDSRGIIIQLEIPTHIDTLDEALYHALRSNSSVIVFGETHRASDLLKLADIANKGCLVMTTYHAPDSVGAIEKLYYEIGNDIMLKALVSTLIGIVNQRLFIVDDNQDTVMRKKFVLVSEWLPVREADQCVTLIVGKRFNEIRESIGKIVWNKQFGSMTFEQHLQQLLQTNTISRNIHDSLLEIIKAQLLYLQQNSRRD